MVVLSWVLFVVALAMLVPGIIMFFINGPNVGANPIPDLSVPQGLLGLLLAIAGFFVWFLANRLNHAIPGFGD